MHIYNVRSLSSIMLAYTLKHFSAGYREAGAKYDISGKMHNLWNLNNSYAYEYVCSLFTDSVWIRGISDDQTPLKDKEAGVVKVYIYI